MTFWQAIILSIIEGFTEFLPISSTGHMILATKLLNITPTEFVKSFEIFIQLGAILAVVVLYFQKIWKQRKLWEPLLIAFIPTGILGLILYKFVKQYLLGNSMLVAWSLLIGGIIIIVLEKWSAKTQKGTLVMKKLSIKQAVSIGLYQSISMIPGVSRAAATIFGGMLSGLSRVEAVEFSFLLAIPTMVAATGLDLLKTEIRFSTQEYQLLAVGFVGAFVVATFAIKGFIRYVQNHNMTVFGWYRIVLALVFLLF